MAKKPAAAAAEQETIDQLCRGFRGAAASRLRRAALQGRLSVEELQKALAMLPAGAQPAKGKA